MFRYRLMRLQAAYYSVSLRLLLIAVGIGMLWLRVEHPGILLAVLWGSYAGLVFVLGMVGYRLTDGVLGWPFRRNWIDPLAYKLRPVLDIPEFIPGRRFIFIPRNFGEEGAPPGRVSFPRSWAPKDETLDHVKDTTLGTLGLTREDAHATHIRQGRSNYLQITLREKLVIPAVARASDAEVIELLEKVESGKHLLALERGSAPLLGDLDGVSPHIGLSMPTGKGKSNTIRGIVAQEMHLGASVVICDIKRRSLRCFKGLDGVWYCRDIGEIHNAIVATAREAMERNVLADELGDDEEPPWQRRILVMEEWNTTIDALNDYWQEIREPSDPKVSPAIRGYRALGNMGRQVNVHAIAAFQKLTAQAAGGTVARDNYGMIIMSGFRAKAWKMLAEEFPMPKLAGKPRGRSWYIADGEAIEGQAIYWTEKEARGWAESGKSSKVVSMSRGSRSSAEPVLQDVYPRRVAGGATLELVPADAGETVERILLTISQASSDKGKGVVQATWNTLRKERVTKTSEFPEPDEIDGQKKLYHPETLQAWERNREQAGSS